MPVSIAWCFMMLWISCCIAVAHPNDSPARFITLSKSSRLTPPTSLPWPLTPPFASRIISLRTSSGTSSRNSFATLLRCASVIGPAPPCVKSWYAALTSSALLSSRYSSSSSSSSSEPCSLECIAIAAYEKKGTKPTKPVLSGSIVERIEDISDFSGARFRELHPC